MQTALAQVRYVSLSFIPFSSWIANHDSGVRVSLDPPCSFPLVTTVVVVTKCKRGKRKCVSNIRGLELFGISLKDAAKALGKVSCTPINWVDRDPAGPPVDHDAREVSPHRVHHRQR